MKHRYQCVSLHIPNPKCPGSKISKQHFKAAQMWDTGLRRGSEKSSEDEEDQRQIFFCLPCSFHASDLLSVSLLVCMFMRVWVCVCASMPAGWEQRGEPEK